MAFVDTIPLGHYGDQVFGLVVTRSPANWNTEPDPLPLTVSADTRWAPHSYIWVRARPVEAMIRQPPDGFPQRKYGYCAGMPLDDDMGAAASMAVAADTPSARERRAETNANDQTDCGGSSDDDGAGGNNDRVSAVTDAEANDADSNSEICWSRATPSQLPRLHVPRARPSTNIPPLPADDSQARVQLHTGATSATQLSGSTSNSSQGRRLSAASSHGSSDINSRQSSSSKASSRLSPIFDTASNGLSDNSPVDSCDGASPVERAVGATRPSDLSGRMPLACYLNHPFLYLGAVYAKQRDAILPAKADNVPWRRMNHVVVVSMYDESVWLLYDAWERATVYDDLPPAEWDDDGEPDSPLPDRHRFRPDYDPHWGRLGSDERKPRRVMARIARSVRDWRALGHADAPLELGPCVFPRRNFPVLVVTCQDDDGSILPPSAVKYAF